MSGRLNEGPPKSLVNPRFKFAIDNWTVITMHAAGHQWEGRPDCQGDENSKEQDQEGIRESMHGLLPVRRAPMYSGSGMKMLVCSELLSCRGTPLYHPSAGPNQRGNH